MALKRVLIAAILTAAFALPLLLPQLTETARDLFLPPPVRETVRAAFSSFAAGGDTEDMIAVFRQFSAHR